MIATRRRVEDLLSLDLAILRRQGRMNCGGSPWFGWAWGEQARADLWLHDDRLEISMAGETQTVRFTWTAAGWGGRRRWFACPGCDRRARVLYRSAGQWRCRRCLSLTYSCQYEQDASDRLSRKAARLLRSHFADDLIPVSPLERMRPRLPPKPCGMHWRRYWALEARQIALSHQWLEAVRARVSLDLACPGLAA